MAINQNSTKSGMNPRVKGLIKVLLGLPLTALGAWYIYNKSKSGPFEDPRIGAFIIGIPAVLLVVGFLEIIFGMGIGEFANEWNRFSSLKQFAISAAILLGILFIGVAVLIILNP